MWLIGREGALLPAAAQSVVLGASAGAVEAELSVPLNSTY